MRPITLSGNSSVMLEPAARFRQLGPLSAAGVRQVLRAEKLAATAYTYPDGSPALVRAALGKGWVYYSATSLRFAEYARLLDWLMGESGVSRPVRARRAAGGDLGRVEVRTARLGGRVLIYAGNFETEPARLTLEVSPAIASLRELREGRAVRGNEVTVPPRQTAIFEVNR